MKLTLLLLLAATQVLSVHVATTGQIADVTPASAKAATADSDVELLESGSGEKLRSADGPAGEIKVVSFNIRWRSGKDLEKIIKFFQDDPEIGNAAVMGLQEVDRRKKRSGHTNTAKLMADKLGLHYAWTAPPVPKKNDEEETGVAILSKFALSDLTRIVLPHPGPNKRRRVALGASIQVNDERWRVYSVHAETRVSVTKKIEQMKAVLDDLARYPAQTPAIVMGDLNTWEADADSKTEKFFKDAGLSTPFGGQATFSRRILFVPLELKLDWVWLRRLEAVSHGIDRKITVSDHWPLWTNVKLRK
jgi:endonuclease/exonuclease/phosphatase family metal-dependent hydrolase